MRPSRGLRRGWGPSRLDVAIVALLAVLGQAELAWTGNSTPTSVALSLGIIVPLLWRRRAPVVVAVIVLGGFGLETLVMQPAPQVLGNSLAAMTAIYTVAAAAGPKAAAPTLVLAAVSMTAFETSQRTRGALVGDFVIMLAVAGIGWFVWQRRNVVDDQLQAAKAEVRAADSRSELALAEERRRIARELHDVVSHAVTVVVLQARGGRSMMSRDPAQTRAALDAIEQSGQEALAEMRRLVTLLREPSLDTAPQPGMSDLPALVESAAASGADVVLTVRGEVAPLGPGTELTAYRLVQEALTNAIRHSPGEPIQVHIHYLASWLTLSVSNPSSTMSCAPHLGYGLLGMRERVELYGGVLEYGWEGREWNVRGKLPYAERAGSPPIMWPVPGLQVESP